MEFLNSKRFIIIMLIVLLWAGLSSCSPTEYADKQAPHETNAEMQDKITKDMEAMDMEKAKEEMPGPTNFEGIVDALGCMFAPDDCPLKQRKEEQKMDR
jgi:PBP1b-binding outer membrane lipoprotein LpoB